MITKLVSREKDVSVLFEIIQNREEYRENSDNGLVILLNGSWGSGKSTFLDELEKKVEESDLCNLFCRYNSYEYDFYETAYIPFFSAIENNLELGENFNKVLKPLARNTAHFSLSTLYTLLNAITKIVNIDLNDIRDNMTAIQDEDYLKDFNDFKDCKEIIKDRLNELCEEKVQIFIIDELDRCKPSFAMETLEIVKHFFDVKNCVFIIAVDKMQLQESAKTIYGQEMDSEKYFSKFFDYQHNLFALDFYETIDTSGIEDLSGIIKESSVIFNELNVSTRDSKKIFGEFVDKYKKFNINDDVWSDVQCIFMIFLFTLKYVDLLFYTELLNGDYYHFSKRFIENINYKSNNYSKLLHRKICDSNKSFAEILELFTGNLNCRYIDIKYAYTEVLGNKKLNEEKNVLIKMMEYIPQIEVNLTYKETIRRIVN